MRAKGKSVLACAGVLLSCGDNTVFDDSWANVSPAIQLPLLAHANHSHESAVIAAGDNVVVAGMNIQFPSADSFEWGSGGSRWVAVWHSSDGGQTFGAANDLGLAHRSSDPVLLAGSAGEFWLGLLNSQTGDVVLTRSPDGGATWTSVAHMLPGFDKPWWAFDEAADDLLLCAAKALARVDRDGTVLDTIATSETNCLSAYVDTTGFHYLTTRGTVEKWSGVTGSAPIVIAELDAGANANVFTRASGSIGKTAEATWIVRSMRTADDAPLVLAVLRDGSLTERSLSLPGEVTFLPVAAMDELGRLHVAWYESSGPIGVLKYSRSASDDLAGDFLEPIVIDAEACPGNGWYPYSSSEEPPGGRRLREYIGLAATSDGAFIAWTHAPTPPSRIYVARVIDRQASNVERTR